MRKSARKKNVRAAAAADASGRKVKAEGYKPAKTFMPNFDKVENFFLIGNELAITYQKQGEYYRHVFNKNVQAIFPESKHFLILYDPAGRLTWKKSRGIMG
jgi:hypothetical protein